VTLYLLAQSPNFFIFDEVKFKSDIFRFHVQDLPEQASWNTDGDIETGNKGHRPGVQGWLLPRATGRSRS